MAEVRSKRTISLETEISLTLASREVSCRVRRNPRARRVLLKVEPGRGLVAVLPRWFPRRDLPGVLEAHREWILRRLAEQDGQKPERGLLSERGTIPYLAEELPLVWAAEPGRKRTAFRWSEDALVVRDGRESPTAEELEAALEAAYRARAREVLSAKISHWAPRVGVHPGDLRIGDMRTRWGSCSLKGTLSFSWRILLAPEPVLEYLVIHELCHLREANHSARFWSLVAGFCAEYSKMRAWLRSQDHLLHR